MITPLFDSIIRGRDCDVKQIQDFWTKELAPQIKCADGTTLSVQASEYHYCTPRQHRGPYSTVEVGYPSAPPPESWAEYFDGDWTPEAACGSVYGYIPTTLVREYIIAHGGEMEATK